MSIFVRYIYQIPFCCCYIGGTYVEGDYLINAFRWKNTVGPWEERPGHFNDIWGYWVDDGLGYFEGLQVGTFFKNIGHFPH